MSDFEELVDTAIDDNIEDKFSIVDKTKAKLIQQAIENTAAFNDKYQGFDVQVQDQTSEVVNYYMRRLIGNALTIVTATINTYTIEITDASAVTAGNSVCIQQGQRAFQAKILTKVGNVLTIDTPLDFAFTNAATCYECSFMMNVNGGVTPISFFINPIAGVKFDVYGFGIEILDQSPMDDNTFGGLTKLVKGIVMRKADDEHRTIFNVKTNGDLKLITGVTNPYSDKAPAGYYGFNVSYSFKDKNGVAERLDGDLGEKLEVIIPEDLTGLDSFRIFVHVHVVE